MQIVYIGETHDRFSHHQAQLVWDMAMAMSVYLLDYLRSHPDHTVIVLAGSVHAWKKGIPTQVREQDSAVNQITILPDTPEGFSKGKAQQQTVTTCCLGLIFRARYRSSLWQKFSEDIPAKLVPAGFEQGAGIQVLWSLGRALMDVHVIVSYECQL